MILLKHFKKVKSDKDTTELVHKDGHKVIVAHNSLSPKMKEQLKEVPHYNGGGFIEDTDRYDTKPKPQNNQQQNNNNKQSSQPATQKPVKYDEYGYPSNYADGGEVDSRSSRIVSPVPGISIDYGKQPRDQGVDPRDSNRSNDRIPPRLEGLKGASDVVNSFKHPTGYADGGDVEDDSEDTNMSMPEQPQEQPMMSPMSQDQMNAIPNAQPQAPMQQPQIPQPGPQQQMLDQMQQNQQQGNQVMNDYAQAQGRQGALESKAYQENQQKLQDLQNMQQQNLQKQDKEMAAWIDDAKNGHIDPKHYVNNMTGGQKVMTAIGLLLGGVSAGLTGKDNPVQKILEDNINRDVEAQKANMSQKNNVFRAMQQRYGNQKDANIATQLFYRNLMVDKVMQAAAQNKGPQAQMQAQMFAVQQQQQMMPLKMQLATNQTINEALQRGTISPEQAIPFKVPEKEQSKAFDSLGKVRAIDQLRTQSMQHFDDIADKMRSGNISPNLIRSEKQLLAGKLVQLSEGRYNYEAAQNMVDAAYPNWDDFGTTIDKKRDNFKGLFDALRAEHEGRLKGYNIPLPAPLTPKSSMGSGFTKRQ